jgi:hypothetical protein
MLLQVTICNSFLICQVYVLLGIILIFLLLALIFCEVFLTKENALETPKNQKIPTPAVPPQVQQPGVQPLGPPQVQQPGLRPLGPPLLPGQVPEFLPMPPYPHQSEQ